MMHFIDRIRTAMRERADAPAIVQLGGTESPGRLVTYGTLERECNALAAALAACCAPGTTVGLVAANSVAWIEADLALLMGGHVEVPVPLAFSAEQAAHLLASCSVVLTDGEGQRRFEAWRADAPHEFQSMPCLSIGALVDGAAAVTAQALSAGTLADRICKVIHTSGTTSAPKGVRIRANGLDALLASLWRHATREDYVRYLNLVPFSLLIEQVTALYMPFAAGGTVVLPPVGEAPLGDPGAVAADKLALLRRARPSAVTLPPSLVEALARAADRLPDLDTAALCAALFGRPTAPLIAAGGAPVAAATIGRLAERGITVLQGYGLSENSSVVSWNTRAENHIGSVGKPLAHVACKLGPDGELGIRSASLFAGYSGSDPSACHTDADGWLWTGDLAAIDADGFITIIGRKKNLIITAHGRNVSPEPAEASYRSVPGVADIVLLGEGQETLSAYVLVAAGVDQHALRRELERHGERWLSGVERAGTFVLEADAPALRAGLFTVTGRPRRQDVERHVRQRHILERQAGKLQGGLPAATTPSHQH
ncbi:AMP-binding protein [Pseudoduganella umbonata]|uniref:Long-chain fatty acid--CoA ligase n=1 Tax=Pseudoduganella umbonata TaxID=864828 RepID=A0A4V1EDB2_9BURK|nr:AMP-binding protein [Pseudoduganella umbonata]MBB3221299.1 long-subunit acyl-CoA synthetase (AMP-forming) [Pseudoduganella umbonata]QCP10471.1 long-chain fatty acid--CoA ligase [Pseudoduganella umbonata]